MPLACLDPLLVLAISPVEDEQWQIGAIAAMCGSHFQGEPSKVRALQRDILDLVT